MMKKQTLSIALTLGLLSAPAAFAASQEHDDSKHCNYLVYTAEETGLKGPYTVCGSVDSNLQSLIDQAKKNLESDERAQLIGKEKLLAFTEELRALQKK